MNDETARNLAGRALVYIAQEPERIRQFLAITGIGPAEIRARAQDPAFLAGILDHLLSDEAMLLDFAAWSEIDTSSVGRSRQFLPGGEATYTKEH